MSGDLCPSGPREKQPQSLFMSQRDPKTVAGFLSGPAGQRFCPRPSRRKSADVTQCYVSRAAKCGGSMERGSRLDLELELRAPPLPHQAQLRCGLPVIPPMLYTFEHFCNKNGGFSLMVCSMAQTK